MRRLPMLDGRGPSQVGILVEDMEAALARYDALWGGGPWRGYRYDATTLPELGYRGGAGRYGVLIAINQTTPQVELLQAVEGPSIYHEWLEHRGYGLHHLGFWVDSVAETTASMTAAGYELIQSGAGYGLDGDGGYAYFDTERDLGILVEAIEVPRRRREPDFVWPP
jgi:catechol 2,3-dioxygenase-like lactoylglutathione lyase family enzyme